VAMWFCEGGGDTFLNTADMNKEMGTCCEYENHFSSLNSVGCL